MRLHPVAVSGFAFAVLSVVLAGCGGANDETVGVGDVEEGVDERAGVWGAALQCKVPHVAAGLVALGAPQIVVSLDGLTLHVTDAPSGFDRVYPIGPGAIDPSGHSLTPTSDAAAGGAFHTGAYTQITSDAQYGDYYSCRIWDVVDGVRKPVFAGLPFMRLAGAPTNGYGLHGPVDHFTDANGGSLRRGYVSHGCVRMAAEDIQELFFLIHKHPKTPVKIQRAVERDANGDAIDLAKRWIGAECNADSDCNYDGGACRRSASDAHGTCTRACTSTCPDRAGEAPTFCVRDPASPAAGICVPQASTTFNNECARFEGRLRFAAKVARPNASASADVCVP